jgi:hypothetical protein
VDQLRETEFLGEWRQLLAVFGTEFDIAGHGIDMRDQRSKV